MKKKSTKKKGRTVAQMKRIAWKVFSVYIRAKDADWNGMVHCYTCPWRGPWRKAQAGHFVPARHNSVLFDERNCHPQCFSCNIWKHGNTLVYYDRMIKDYGQKVIDEIRRKDKGVKQFTVKELDSMIADWKSKIKVKI